MHTDRSNRAHALRALTLLTAAYITARTLRWTGPDSSIRWMPELMYPAMAIILCWGVARLTRRW